MTCGGPPPAAPKPEGDPDTNAGDAEVAELGTGTGTGDEDEVLPAFNPEALAARVDAQRLLLGEDSLFEDIDGHPVAPKLEVDPSGAEVGSVEDDLLLALPGSAGFGVGGQAGAGGDDPAANGNALGLYVPIEDPGTGPALAHFHQALRDLRSGALGPDGKVRVLVYGASHTQADVYPGYLRVYLQARFGDGGPGFLSLVKVNRWFRYADWEIEETKGWKSEHAQRGSARKDGFYGLLGASGSSDSKRDRTKLLPRNGETVASRFSLFYLSQPKGGSFTLYVDGNKQSKVETDFGNYGTGYLDFTLDEGSHSLELRPVGDGEVRLFGVVMERDQPGVVVDTLGIAGTRASNMLNWDEGIWSNNLRRRDPDLIILAYGTNEATDEDQPMSDYRAKLREVLTRIKRASPDASCLLVGPGDFPRELEEDVWIPRPRVLEIIDAQRDIAYEMGCGFWDAMAFMGGVNSMHTWATSRPQMASRDHIHLTKRGYVRMGMALTDALMARFDREPVD